MILVQEKQLNLSWPQELLRDICGCEIDLYNRIQRKALIHQGDTWFERNGKRFLPFLYKKELEIWKYDISCFIVLYSFMLCSLVPLDKKKLLSDGLFKLLDKGNENGWLDSFNSMNPLLIFFAKIDDEDVVNKLLAMGTINLDRRDCDSNTALTWAIANASNSAAKTLIQHMKESKSINFYTTWNGLRNTALHLAVGKGYVDRDSEDRPLKVSNLEIVCELLKKNANPNLPNHDGNTPLHLAYARRDISMIKALLSAQANRTLKNRNGMTPEQLWYLGYQSAVAPDFRTFVLASINNQLVAKN